jgi:hypothetical protein
LEKSPSRTYTIKRLERQLNQKVLASRKSKGIYRIIKEIGLIYL